MLVLFKLVRKKKKVVSLDTFRNMEAILFPCGGGAEREVSAG